MPGFIAVVKLSAAVQEGLPARRLRFDLHVSFGVATRAKPAAPDGLSGCGVDFGVACPVSASDGTAPGLD